MFHFAANYIFDGNNLIKNSLVTVSSEGEVLFVGEKDEGLMERPRMIFYNGIISPILINDEITHFFDDKINVNSIEYQRSALNLMKKFSLSFPNRSLLELLVEFTQKSMNNTVCNCLCKGYISRIILLEKVDLLDLKLKVDTFVKILN